MDETLYLICILILLSQNILTAAYTLTTSQFVSDGQTLTSQGGKFDLGFFSPITVSKNRYLGIWYKTIPVQTVVWVANREAPVPDTSGVVKIDTAGNIVVIDDKEAVFWSSNLSKSVENPILEFLESGNLVVREARNENPNSYLWQSFDYPGNTLLPGMKLGWKLKTGMNRQLSSWRTFDNPSRGDFTLGIEIAGYPEYIMRKGSTKYYHAGSWNGVQNSGAPDLQPNSMFTYEYIQDAEEIFIRYQLVNHSAIMHHVLVQSDTEGRVDRLIWVDKSNSWSNLHSTPRDRCDKYDLCGIYSTCDVTNVSICQCLQGFEPKSPKDWSATDWSQGCEREVPLNCSDGEGFRKYTQVKRPETANSLFNISMNLEECRLMCLNDCSCIAYANSDITEGGSGCIMWFTNLSDIKQFSSGGQYLYIRMPASELEYEANSRTKKSVTKVVVITSVAGIIVLGFASWFMWKKKILKGGTEKDDLQLPLYSLATTTVATNNFSMGNKLGEGGFTINFE